MENVKMKCKKCGENIYLTLPEETMRVFKSAKCTCGGNFEITLLEEDTNESAKTNRN